MRRRASRRGGQAGTNEGGGVDGSSAPPTSKVTAKPWRRIRTGCPSMLYLLRVFLSYFIISLCGQHPVHPSAGTRRHGPSLLPPLPRPPLPLPNPTNTGGGALGGAAVEEEGRRRGTTDDRLPVVGSPLTSNIPFFSSVNRVQSPSSQRRGLPTHIPSAKREFSKERKRLNKQQSPSRTHRKKKKFSNKRKENYLSAATFE